MHRHLRSTGEDGCSAAIILFLRDMTAIPHHLERPERLALGFGGGLGTAFGICAGRGDGRPAPDPSGFGVVPNRRESFAHRPIQHVVDTTRHDTHRQGSLVSAIARFLETYAVSRAGAKAFREVFVVPEKTHDRRRGRVYLVDT